MNYFGILFFVPINRSPRNSEITLSARLAIYTRTKKEAILKYTLATKTSPEGVIPNVEIHHDTLKSGRFVLLWRGGPRLRADRDRLTLLGCMLRLHLKCRTWCSIPTLR